MKTFLNMTELLHNAPAYIYSKVKEVLKTISTETGDSFEELYRQDFDSLLGGDVFLVESVEDLKEILTGDQDKDGNLLSIYDIAAPFDACEEDGDYVFIFSATNNSGGPSYWIPNSVAKECPNVAASIAKTKGYWSE